MIKGKISNGVYLPASAVPPKLLREFTYRFRDIETVEVIDSDGETQFEERPISVTVENFRRRGKTIRIHSGRLALIKAKLPEVTWKDCRASVPLPRGIKMTSTPRYNQETCLLEYQLADGYGLVLAPTSWGKCFYGIYVAVRLNQRVLVITARTNWCENWIREVYAHTNAKVLESRGYKPLAGILQAGKIKSVDDVFPFSVATPNAFMSHRGKAMRRILRHAFGMVIFDEAVMLPALETSKVFTAFAPRWRMGLSADEVRRDRRHKLTYDYCGPVVTQGVFLGCQKTAEVVPVETGEQVNSRYIYGAQWYGSLCTQLSRRRARNSLVVDGVLDDVISGYKVLVLVDRRAQALQLQSMLKSERVPIIGDGKQKTREIVSEILMGGDCKQQQKILAVGSREYDVLIATDRSVGMNTDMPGIDCVHDLSPTTNVQTLKQRRGRVLRDYRMCQSCKRTSSDGKDVCSKCGGSMLDAKHWPVKIVIYHDTAYPEDSRIAGFLNRSWELKIQMYGGDENVASSRKGSNYGPKEPSYIVRKKDYV